MTTKVKKSRMAEISKVIFSGLFGVILTILYQYFLNPPQSFTFIYNGNEVLVTETEYVDLVEQNNSLKEQLETMQIELSSLQTQRENQESAQAIEQLLKQATDYWHSSDYVQALSLLKNSNIQSEDIQFLYSKYSTEYTLSLLVQADNVIAEKRYDDAISLLTAGQSLVSDPENIQNKISEIRDNAPIKLSKLKITSS